jgi:uncharacterized protein YegL
MHARRIEPTFERALRARRGGDARGAVRLLASLPPAGPAGAALAMTAARILLHDLGDAARAVRFLERATRLAPRSRAAARLLRLARRQMTKPHPQRSLPEENDVSTTLDPEFINNEQRLACMLLLDTSGSMGNGRIDRLNQGVASLIGALKEDELASKRVDLAVITFGSEVTLVQDFSNPDAWEAPRFEADGVTNMGEAIVQALDRLETRKQEYKDAGIAYYRPWLFLLTDGVPTDSTELATQRLRTAQQKKQVKVFAVGVGDEIDVAALQAITASEPVKLNESRWTDMFQWLSQSVAAVSHSQEVSEQVALPPPTWLTNN